MDGRRNADLASQANDGAAQPRQLEPPAPFEILEHRCLGLRRQRAIRLRHVCNRRRRYLDAVRVGNRQAFCDGGLQHLEQFRVADCDADRGARDARHAGEHGEAYELGPDVDLNIVAEHRLESGAATDVQQPRQARRLRPIQLTEDQLLHRGVADHAGLGDDRRHVAGTAGGVRMDPLTKAQPEIGKLPWANESMWVVPAP